MHVVFAGEKVWSEYLLPAPDVNESWETPTCKVLSLAALLRMKLTSFQDKDRTHVRDLIDVELVGESWVPRLPAKLGARLHQIIDNQEV